MRSLKKLNNVTEFQLYSKRNPAINDCSNVIDFTERRLAFKALKAQKGSNIKMSTSYLNLLRSYIEGNVIVAWKNGEPKYLNVE